MKFISHLKKYINKNLVKIITLSLFVLPFFWFMPGEIDLGGDSGRLYIYDPLKYLTSITLFPIKTMNGFDYYQPKYLYIPYVGMLLLFKTILFNSAYLLNNFLNGVVLSLGFLFTFKFFKEFGLFRNLKWDKFTLSFCSLFFILSPMTIYDFQRANFHTTSIFVYPLIFYLFLRYMNTQKLNYIIISVLITLPFSPNFGVPTIPWLFSFLPFMFFLFLVYAISNSKSKILIKGSFVWIILFLLVNFFHLYPLAYGFVSKSSEIHRIVFDDSASNAGLKYFRVIQPEIKSIYSFLNQPQYRLIGPSGNTTKVFMKYFGIIVLPLFLIYPLILIAGLLVRRFEENKEKYLYYVVWLNFLWALVLSTASLGKGAVVLYEKLFLKVPGFLMFRHFYGKFAMVYTFFYAFLLYFSLSYVIQYLLVIKKEEYIKKLLSTLFILVIFSGIPLLFGQIVNSGVPGSDVFSGKVPVSMKMDSNFTAYINEISDLEGDSRVVSFPLSMETYQVFQGKGGGVYLGPSVIAVLSGKSDFAGFYSMHNQELTNTFFRLFLQDDPSKILRFLGFMNIEYISYNSDDYIYKHFSYTPFGDFKKLFPTQGSIEKLINILDGKLVFEKGFYKLYKLEKYFLPHIYLPKKILFSNETLTDFYRNTNFENLPKEIAVFFGDNSFSEILTPPEIVFKKISPVKYKVELKNIQEPFVLVLSEPYNIGWNIYLTDKNEFLYSRHQMVNGYANSWYITPKDLNNQEEAELILEYTEYRKFYVGVIVSSISLMMCLVYLVIERVRRE